MSGTLIKSREAAGQEFWPAAVPLALMPAIVGVWLFDAPPWQMMWGMAVAIYLGFKWLSFATCDRRQRASRGWAVGYLLLWPGMDAKAFFDDRREVARPAIGEWLLAAVKLTAGLILIFVVAPREYPTRPFLAGWIGMVGIALALLFGLVHVASLAWRTQGVDAAPIMDWPPLATSLGDFWGKRWNLAFRDLMFRFVFRPLAGVVGTVGAVMGVFLVSGIVHDVPLSVPSRGGYGQPLLYFLIQGAGQLFERSHAGRAIGLGRGIRGRIYAALLVLGPLGLLFHAPFIYRVILPTLHAIGAI